MKKLKLQLFFAIFIWVSTNATAQKHDYRWMFMTSDLVTFFDFNDNERKIYPGNAPINIDQVNLTICDAEGDFLFYSNGCFIYGSDNNILINGDSLNYNELQVLTAGPNCRSGYSGANNIMGIPSSYDSTIYYVFHYIYERDSVYVITFNRNLYSKIKIDGNGNGEVLEKNVSFNETDDLIGGHLHAVKHANGRDWWLIQMRGESNEYMKLILDEQGPRYDHCDYFGDTIPSWFVSAAGQGKFSPDGRMWAYHNSYTGLHLFDFDRSTGRMSNYRQKRIIHPVGTGGFSGMEWSSNGRFLYVSTLDSLWQVDMDRFEEEPATLVDVWDGTFEIFKRRFAFMQRGPDCKIYMSSLSSSPTIHVINNPDEKYPACNFVQHGVQLYNSTGTASMPVFPNYRLDNGPPCDPNIVTGVSEGGAIFTDPNERWQLYPNPTQDAAYISVRYDGSLWVYDMSGRQLERVEIEAGTPYRLDTSSYPSGLYIIRYIDRQGRTSHEKLSVVR